MTTVISALPGRGLALAATVAGLIAAAAPAPGLAQNGPVAGTYRTSCADYLVTNGTLSASCRRPDGGWRDTSLVHVEDCVGDIANHDGQLYCEKRSHSSGDSSAVAAGAVVGALIGLAIAAGAKSDGNSSAPANNAVSAPAPVTTRAQGGFHTSSASTCDAGTPIYLAFRMGGDPNNLWPIIVDKGTRVELQLPQGTTESSKCGSPPGPADTWVYPSVH